MKSPKSLVILGGAGALGKGVVTRFINRFSVLSIDYAKNENAPFNFVLDHDLTLESQISPLCEVINSELNADKWYLIFKIRGVDSIICTAGGFVAGSGKDDDVFAKWEVMNNQLVKSSLLTYHLASLFLKPKGICIFLGAHAAFKDTSPEMLAYHTGKVATHNIALNLANSKDLAEGARVLTILP